VFFTEVRRIILSALFDSRQVRQSQACIRCCNSETAVSQERIDDLTRWLCAPDPLSNYQKAKKQRQVGTCLWFLEGKQYAQFRNGTARFMWLHGILGCGKSVLSSIILDDLFQFCQSQYRWMVAYFYFDFSDSQKQTPEAMARSIITQLVRKCSMIPYSLYALFSQYQQSSQQQSVELYLRVLKDVIHSFPRVYLVLDALDECGSRTELTDLLTVMAEWKIETLQLLVTSRKVRDIERCLEDVVEEKYIISLQSDMIDSDIQLYIRERLCNDKDLRKWRKDGELQDEIEKMLVRGAHGM
jgi:NACHT domain